MMTPEKLYKLSRLLNDLADACECPVDKAAVDAVQEIVSRKEETLENLRDRLDNKEKS